MNLSYFALGYVTVFADIDSITSILNVCMYNSIAYTDFQVGKDGVTLCFRLAAFKKIEKAAVERGIGYKVIKRSGIPVILEKYKLRAGLFIGIIAAALLIFFANRFVWDIEVSGNNNLTSEEVRLFLSEHGFSVGSYIPKTNTDKIENKILIDTDRISWISINIIGTVAHVEIREREMPMTESVVTKPANIVAKKSGIIEEVRLFRGKAVVGAGRYVNKGELLVSGLFDSVQVGFRYTRASGEVYARTVEEFYIEIPYEYVGKRYTGEEYSNKYLNFFDYSMNISKKYGNEDSLYDKIYIVEDYSLFGKLLTPFSVATERYLEYENVSMTRTPEVAEELAYFALEEKLSKLAEETVIMKKAVTPLIRDDRFMLRCTLVLIEDIAEISEFEVELEGQK